MKSLVVVLTLAGALGLTAGCGPQEAFCPNVGADAGGVCPIFGDDAMAPTQDTGTMTGCPPGEGYKIVDGGLVCVPTP